MQIVDSEDYFVRDILLKRNIRPGKVSFWTQKRGFRSDDVPFHLGNFLGEPAVNFQRVV